MASPRTEMSLFSALFHFLSILPGEWMQKLYQMTYYKVNGSYFCISFIIILYPLKVITFFFLFLKKKIAENTERRRKRASEQLRADLTTGKARGEKRVYIEFPLDTDHANHFLGQVSVFVKGQNKSMGITQPLNFVREYTKQNESWSKQNSAFGFQVAGISQRIDPRIVEKYKL